MSIPGIKYIKRLNPKIKILMLLRDHVLRAFSHAKMDLLRNKGIGPENEILKYYIKSIMKQPQKFIITKPLLEGGVRYLVLTYLS